MKSDMKILTEKAKLVMKQYKKEYPEIKMVFSPKEEIGVLALQQRFNPAVDS